MSIPKHFTELIEEILKSKSGMYPDARRQMLYERGYLTGILARLAYDDSSVRVKLEHILKRNREK